MSIEKLVRKPSEEEVRVVDEKIRAFIAADRESTELDFSPKEIRDAAELIATRLVDSGKSAEMLSDDILRRALEARVSVRGVSERIPVMDSQGMVIGTASSPNEAKEMARRENESRDLS